MITAVEVGRVSMGPVGLPEIPEQAVVVAGWRSRKEVWRYGSGTGR
jgi:hypothetical protein